MIKMISIGIVLIVLLLSLTACGISQEEYDAVIAERDAAKAEVVSINNELYDTQDKLENIQSELAEAESDQVKILSDLTQAQKELSELQDDLAETEDLIFILEEKIAQEEGSSVGDLAPAFELKNLNGNIFSLTDYWGSPIVLNFWATWCGHCRYEMPFLQQIYEERQDGLVLLTINARESSDEVQQFMREYELTFPVLFDTNGEVNRKYYITGIPTTFFIDKFGVIQAKQVGSFSSKQQIEDYVKKIIQ
jgi:thiol-disulfide isomerase/thioredoxin